MCCVFQVGAFISVAYAKSKPVVLFGVCLSSLSMGVGESTLIGLTTFYHRNTIFALSSGTGGAAIFSSFVYTGLKQLQLSTKVVLLIQLLIPVIQTLAFWILLRPPVGFQRKGLKFQPVHFGTAAPIPVVVMSKESASGDDSDEENLMVPSFIMLPKVDDENLAQKPITLMENFKDELHYIPTIGKYFIPLCANYFLNYFTNQGLVRVF